MNEEHCAFGHVMFMWMIMMCGLSILLSTKLSVIQTAL